MDKCQSAVRALTFLPCPGRHPSLLSPLPAPCCTTLSGDTGVSALQPTPLKFTYLLINFQSNWLWTIFHVRQNAKLHHAVFQHE